MTTQAAELFLKQQKNQFDTIKVASEEKEKQLTLNNQEMKRRLQLEVEESQQKMNTLTFEKIEFERKCRTL